MTGERIVVFGGSGFLGRAITSRLSADGIETCVAVRHPERIRGLGHAPGKGLVQPVRVDIRDEASVGDVINGCGGVVNAVGLYVETKLETFEAIHERGARNIAQQVADQEIERLIHISGIGADASSPSRYVRTRARGEASVREACPWATILRPSVLFGSDDGFVHALAGIARRSPIVPLFGRGRTRLQPVHVGDVAASVVNALRLPATRGQVFELGGPRAYSYREILELVFAWMGCPRPLVPVPFWVWELLAAIGSVFSKPPITSAQVALMRADNVVAENQLSLVDLGIEPSSMETFLTDHPWQG